MIVPSKNQKTYGVLHTENYFSFLGFCKKVNSDEIQKVDVYLDDALIDTIIADKHLQKIEDIYELDGFGFTYNLANEYIGNKKSMSFKNHLTKEDLQNSPYKLINNTNRNFNEAKFIHSLIQPHNLEKIKDLYYPNSIGFFATNENLNDEIFLSYIKEFIILFPQTIFQAFYFDEESKELAKKLLADDEERITYILPTNICDVAGNVEIMVCNECKNFDNIALNNTISINSNNIFVLYIYSPHAELSLEKYDEILKETSHPILTNPELFMLNKEKLKDYNYSVSNFFINSFSNTNKVYLSVKELFYFELINQVLLGNKNIKIWHQIIFSIVYKGKSNGI